MPDDYPIDEAYYLQLLRVARSAGLDLAENRAKDELVQRLSEAGVERVSYDEWEQDGEPLELLPPQTQSANEPKDETILYCLTRDATTEERLNEIEAALNDAGYELLEAGEEGDNYKIVDPADDGESESDPAEMSREELYERAQDLDIDGRSDMTKEELEAAIEEARSDQ